MSYDYESEQDYYDSEETEFYTGYRSPADEWKVNRQSLFKEFQGSVFQANDKITKRLARLNEVIAFSESKETKKINKKSYIANNYSFLQEFIPENIFEKITEIMAFTQKEKKKIAKDIRLNVETLATILGLWQLELYSTGSYISEITLNEINVFLKESSSYGDFRHKGHITSKDIERAEGRILRQIYYQENSINKLDPKTPKIPTRVFNYYRAFITSLDTYLNDNQKQLQEKGPMLPFHVYLLVQKKELMKRILPKIASEYFKCYIDPKDLMNLNGIIDEYYRDKNAMVGELVAQSIVILEQYYNRDANLEQSGSGNLPRKFLTRIRKYRETFSDEFRQIIGFVRKNLINEEVESEVILENPFVTEINERIDESINHEVQSWNYDDLGVDQIKPIHKESNVNIKYRYIQRGLGISDEIFEVIETSLLWYEFRYKIRRKISHILLLTLMLIICNYELYIHNQFIINENWEESKSNQISYIELFITKISSLNAPKNTSASKKIIILSSE